MSDSTWENGVVAALAKPTVLIQLVVTAVAAAGLYYGLAARIDKGEAVNIQQTHELDEFRNQRRENMANMQAQIRDVDKKADVKLEIIQRDVSEIKGLQREMKANLEWIIERGRSPNTRPIR